MDLINILQRLNAISEESKKKPDDDNDGVPNWADKKPGADDNEDKKKANEDIMNVMRGLKAIQEANIEEDDVEEGNEFSGALEKAKAAGEEEFEVAGKKYKVNECGDMPMDMGAMSPLSMADGSEEETEMPAAPEAKDRYTLSITKADGTTLNATTDVPEELAALMKAVGMSGKAAVAPAQQGAEEVEEEFGNTPNATNERDPRSHGQTKNWGLPGTGAGKPNYPGTKASGDNPMAESMFKEYLKFKSGK